MAEFDGHQKARGFFVPRSPSNVINSEPDTREIQDAIQLIFGKLFGTSANGSTEILAYTNGSLKVSESNGGLTAIQQTLSIPTGTTATINAPTGATFAAAYAGPSGLPCSYQISVDGVTYSTNSVASLTAIMQALVTPVRGYQFFNTNAGTITVQFMGYYRT